MGRENGFRSRSTSAIPPGREEGGEMTAVATSALPHRRPDLLVRPLDGGDRCVVKDPDSGEYFELGAQEYFLISQLGGDRTPEEVRRVYDEKFGEPLSEEELEGFLDLATAQGFLPLAEEEPPSQVCLEHRAPSHAR